MIYNMNDNSCVFNLMFPSFALLPKPHPFLSTLSKFAVLYCYAICFFNSSLFLNQKKGFLPSSSKTTMRLKWGVVFFFSCGQSCCRPPWFSCTPQQRALGPRTACVFCSSDCNGGLNCIYNYGPFPYPINITLATSLRQSEYELPSCACACTHPPTILNIVGDKATNHCEGGGFWWSLVIKTIKE